MPHLYHYSCDVTSFPFSVCVFSSCLMSTQFLFIAFLRNVCLWMFCPLLCAVFLWYIKYICIYFSINILYAVLYTGGADKFLARPGRKQATATEDFDVHISYL